MKVTRINPNTITVQLDPETEPSVITRRGPAASHINCGSAEVQRYLWDHLEHLAERPSFEDQLFDAKEARLDYEDLDLKVGTLKGDIERQDQRMAKLEERLEMLSSECATDYRDHENRIASLENADKCNDTAHQHLQKLIRNLETRHETLRDNTSEAIDGIKHDIDSHGRQLEDLENAAETAETPTVDDDELHDAIATYIMAKPNALRRAIIDIITDKLS